MDYSQFKHLEFRRRFWVLFGAKITVANPENDQVIGFIKMKAWKLKEDVRLYTDESMASELIRIHARSVIDFGATYDVFDSASSTPLFSMRRKGLKSMFVRDHWDFTDSNGAGVGSIQETSSQLALFRRWLGIIPYIGDFIDLFFAFVPQTYTITVDDKTVATITHRKNPFIVKMALDSSMSDATADPRIGIASAAMLSIIDASKNS